MGSGVPCVLLLVEKVDLGLVRFECLGHSIDLVSDSDEEKVIEVRFFREEIISDMLG